MYDPHTKESRGFGFVMMKTHDDAMKAIAELDNKEFMGKCIRIQVVRHAQLQIDVQQGVDAPSYR
jgi:RNA recognition motif-containing protein